ncbi:Maltase A3 [Lucilia cuprina]|uniref:alpha-glucosidase n=1 Tax=Lucilia cuprina TaxID=7375 RepID=A0A0L0CMV9_LUCCU|nr:Maltase A3 [Lucilia cuprina]KAI8123737.1 Maltase A3 [Lucilia cuprina]KNC33640.1 Maltase A3 [Lucilia cuprina]
MIRVKLRLGQFFIVLAVFLVSSQAENLKWWQTASFYQIYPRSFKDSDGDGVGDLKGVTQQLPYLKEIGITATWLSPIFTSPMADFGYDVANLTEIDPIFGTMEDFEALVETAKKIGVKIILDFVPNHTSDECEWFIKSAANDPTYKDFYVWHPGKIVDGVRQPPTTWISVFRGSMWTWHEERQAYYLHQFHAKQPDLNYRNPKVMEAMKDVLRFWLRKGASGFRVDAVPHTFEIAPDSDGNYPDEPRNPNNNDPEDYEYFQHIYTTNQPETIDMIYQFREVMEQMDKELGGDNRILMTEAYAPLDVIMQYYGNATHEGAQIPFNFELISNLRNDSTAYHYEQLINNWLSNMPEGRSANWVVGNHDRNRVASRLGEDKIDLINMLVLTLPGCSVNYQGEEIGMTDVWISWNDTVDPQACQSNPQNYERLTRDPVRTPFQWSDEPFAGFTKGSSTWLPVADNYKLVNVKRERGISQSHLNIYKQLQELRREPTFQQGLGEVKALSEGVLAIKRSLGGSPSYVILLNLGKNVESFNLNNFFYGLSSQLQYALVTDTSPRRKGDYLDTVSVLLMPKEAVVLKTV